MSVYVALQSVGTSIDAADAYLAAKRWENATQAYQAAGNQAVALALTPASTPPNAQLQALQWKLASQATAKQAQSLAKQILALYTQAYGNSPQPIVPAKSTAIAQTQGTTNWFLWGLVAVGVGALGYFIIRGPAGMNPTSGGRGPKGKKLVSKGHSCIFELKDGRDVKATGGMMHDPSGRSWPSRSVLIGPFRGNLRRAQPHEVDGAARHYLGNSHPAKIGLVNTPPKALGAWTYVGEVENIIYTRTGRRRPGRYQHPFNKSWVTIFTGKKRVRLYRRGRYYRLQLPRKAILDSRGYVVP